MFQLTRKRKELEDSATRPAASSTSNRQRLLLKEVPEASEAAPSTCQLVFPDVNRLHEFSLIVTPDEGYWKGGQFEFDIKVPEDYSFSPPKCLCRTKLWHPNITENGEVCLSILREKMDGHSWLPTRTLKEVVWGISSLFTDLLNFDDPLNVEAAEMHAKSEQTFASKVRQYIQDYASGQSAGDARRKPSAFSTGV